MSEHDDVVDELLGDDTVEETEDVSEKEVTRLTANSVYSYVENIVNMPVFFFNFGDPTVAAGARGMVLEGYIPSEDSGFFSLKQLMTKPEFLQILPRQFESRYRNITNFGLAEENLEEELQDLLSDINEYFTENVETKVGNEIVAYDKELTDRGSVPTTINLYGENTGERTSFKDFLATIDGTNVPTIKEKAEAFVTQVEQEAELATSQQIQNNKDSYSTSGNAWGITTTQEGLIANPEKPTEFMTAPFIKGDEYRDFVDMSEAEIFKLQKQMVAAGMSPPSIDEFGQWTAREANFMVGIFVQATDSGTWFQDSQNRVPMWTTALANVTANFKEREDFTNLLRSEGYGVPAPNPTTSQIKSLLDGAAAANGVVLSQSDYVNFANVVIKAMQQSEQSQRDSDNATVTDRDLIFKTNFRDARSVQKGEYARFLDGSPLPLVLPSYEFLTQEAGYQPPVLSTEEILNDEIKKLKSKQIEGNQDLAQIKYATNLFETAMGKLTYGGAEKDN
tara:strand:+ start:2597 stop:4117 length:1521 start_codon:yes stop_codon:yes gene_type:complete